MAWKALPLRPYVKPTEQVHGLIAPSHCWHFDAWMLRDDLGALYLRVETRAGGRELLTSAEYSADGGTLRMVKQVPISAQPVTLQDKSEWANADALNDLHRRYVLPMIARRPAGYRSQSVRLHYVRAPSLPPIPDDVANWTQ